MQFVAGVLSTLEIRTGMWASCLIDLFLQIRDMKNVMSEDSAFCNIDSSPIETAEKDCVLCVSCESKSKNRG